MHTKLVCNVELIWWCWGSVDVEDSIGKRFNDKSFVFGISRDRIFMAFQPSKQLPHLPTRPLTKHDRARSWEYKTELRFIKWNPRVVKPSHCLESKFTPRRGSINYFFEFLTTDCLRVPYWGLWRAWLRVKALSLNDHRALEDWDRIWIGVRHAESYWKG